MRRLVKIALVVAIVITCFPFIAAGFAWRCVSQSFRAGANLADVADEWVAS